MTYGKNRVDSLKVTGFTGSNLRITANGNDNFFYLSDTQMSMFVDELNRYLRVKRTDLRNTSNVLKTELEAFEQGEKLDTDTITRIASYYKFVAKYGSEAAEKRVIDEEAEDEALEAYLEECRYNHEVDLRGYEIKGDGK